ncbi:hypothetical protein HPB47_016028 [Ixodes persulcatus]|uniref:Uncharacterized protein n=1 Tax=Ixodes persulcatus TaxID=34615 RepID=A0AC60QVL2_IXOPE|nr:hypothetical protein HPB47_016028 [Ixodes persulcatus]
MLMARMEASCEAMKLRLKATLGEVTYVTVTADCWATFRRLFGEKDVEDAPHNKDDEAFTEAVEVAPALDNVAAGEARLPPHHRCSAHTLNLVATADASEAQRHEIFTRPLRSVLGTCRALWCKQGQSAIAAETIINYCGINLLRPVSTRWNSFFDALDCLTALDCNGKDIEGLCRALYVPQFQRPRDLLLMKEYCEVMNPLACAIDVIQKDQSMYIGFDQLHGDRELLLASALIPRFKANWVDWVTDLARREALVEQLTDALSRPCYRSTTAIDAPINQEEGADHSTIVGYKSRSFAMTTASSSISQKEASRFLQDAECTSIASLQRYEYLLRVSGGDQGLAEPATHQEQGCLQPSPVEAIVATGSSPYKALRLLELNEI